MGLVIPKSLTFSQRWGVVRDFILRNLKLIELADTSKAFPGVLLEQVILLCQKSNEKTKSFRRIHFFLEEEPVSMHARFIVDLIHILI